VRLVGFIIRKDQRSSVIWCSVFFGVCCQRCGRTYRSHFQGSRNPRRLLMMEPTNYHSTLRNIPEERVSHFLQYSSRQSATTLDAQKAEFGLFHYHPMSRFSRCLGSPPVSPLWPFHLIFFDFIATYLYKILRAAVQYCSTSCRVLTAVLFSLLT
jgi:hypothetical protein